MEPGNTGVPPVPLVPRGQTGAHDCGRMPGTRSQAVWHGRWPLEGADPASTLRPAPVTMAVGLTLGSIYEVALI